MQETQMPSKTEVLAALSAHMAKEAAERKGHQQALSREATANARDHFRRAAPNETRRLDGLAATLAHVQRGALHALWAARGETVPILIEKGRGWVLVPNGGAREFVVGGVRFTAIDPTTPKAAKLLNDGMEQLVA